MPRIDTVEARSKLKPRDEPYWQRLSAGCYLGFRRMTTASTGTWIAGYRDADTKKRTKRSLGELDEVPASKRFDTAVLVANDWFKHLGRGGSTEVVTVGIACKRWVEHKKNVKGDTAATEVEARFNRWIYNSSIAKQPLNKLTRSHVDAWRASMTKTQVVINPYSSEKKMRARSASTINRDMSELRAALNFAHDNNWVIDDSAWRLSLRSIKNAGGRRDVYLNIAQRSNLIEHSETAFANFLKGLSLLPLRPGALAQLTASNFDSRLSVLTIGQDKQGRDRKMKIPETTALFLNQMSTGKDNSERIFTRSDGKPWDRHAWKKLFKAAIKRTNLPETFTLYALRHSCITDLVTGGLDLMTTALISGTSVAMIERHYGHLRHDLALSALEKLKL